MAWSNTQKQIFARACKAINLNDEQRHMVLSNLPSDRAFCPRKKRHSSAAVKLNQSDFECAMETIESYSGGQVILPATRNREAHKYAPHYWARQAANDRQRLQFLVAKLHELLKHPQLDGSVPLNRDALPGIVRRMSFDQRTDDLYALDHKELHNLIEALKAIAKRNKIRIDHLLKHQPHPRGRSRASSPSRKTADACVET